VLVLYRYTWCVSIIQIYLMC